MRLVRYPPNDVAPWWQNPFSPWFDLSLGSFVDEGGPPGRAWLPAVDIHEEDNQILIQADLPDLDPNEVSLQVNDGVLSLKGERRQKEERQGDRYSRRERRYGVFSREFRLPETVDAEGISADYDKGVVRIRLPKREVSKPRQIQVKASNN